MKNYKIAAALIGSFALGVTAASVLHAQSMAPYYEVTEIAVKDQAGYEASGVDKVREALKASGAKLLAGGYNKAAAVEGTPPANRFLIFVYPNKAAAEKVWADSIRPWMKQADKYVASFRTVGVEGIEPK
jgi:uncharacterized protein (DUF1330 family)